MPAGFAGDGFPLSVQIVGPPDGEGVLLSLAAQLERARDWPAHRPAAGGMSAGELLALAERVAREAGEQLREAFAGPGRPTCSPRARRPTSCQRPTRRRRS